MTTLYGLTAVALFVLPCLVIICVPALALTAVRLDLCAAGRILAAIVAMLACIAFAGWVAATEVTEFLSL